MRPETAEGVETLRRDTGIRFRANRDTAILILKDDIRLKPAEIALSGGFFVLILNGYLRSNAVKKFSTAYHLIRLFNK